MPSCARRSGASKTTESCFWTKSTRFAPAEASLIKQSVALLATEKVDLVFTEDAIDALADVAVEVNTSLENIGARRLQTVIERVLDEISFSASDREGETYKIDGAFVRAQVEDLAKNADLSRYIL